MQQMTKVDRYWKKARRRKDRVPSITTAFSRGLSPSLDFDTTEVLESLSVEILKRVRANIRQTAFSQAAKRRLAKAVKVELKPKSLQVVALDPLWNYLIRGQKKGPMKWLLKARAPIPIVTETGEVIFRSATARSLADGRWIHPGRPTLDVTSAAVKASRELIKKRLKRALVAKVRAATGVTVG